MNSLNRYLLILSLLVSLAATACRRSQPPEVVAWRQRLVQNELTSSQFTAIVADAIREALPQCPVKVMEPLQIDVTPASGTTTCYLDNLWKEARIDPDVRVAVVERHLEVLAASILERRAAVPAISAVVPLIKDQRWLDESLAQGLDVHRQPFVADLFVVYAVDLPEQLAFLSDSDVTALGLTAEKLRSRAILNLQERLPDVTRHGDGPLFMLTAGGTFEASLVLLDEIWQRQLAAVEGGLVVAIPARDVLLFSQIDAEGAIQQMRGQIADVFTSGSYLISRTMLVREAAGWRPWEE